MRRAAAEPSADEKTSLSRRPRAPRRSAGARCVPPRPAGARCATRRGPMARRRCAWSSHRSAPPRRRAGSASSSRPCAPEAPWRRRPSRRRRKKETTTITSSPTRKMKTTTMSSQHRRSQHLLRGVDELEERRVQPPRLPRLKGNNNNQIQNFPTTTRKCQIPKTTRISLVRNLRRRREVELLLPPWLTRRALYCSLPDWLHA